MHVLAQFASETLRVVRIALQLLLYVPGIHYQNGTRFPSEAFG